MLDLLQLLFTNAWYIILIALFFGGSIFVHELGHFLAARWRGLKIDRFSIGFGPKIVAWTRGGVEYRLSWFPLGGYVALPQLADMRGIEGEPSSDADKLPPISYTDKMIVSVAGAVFNVLFAFLLACVLWVIKQPVSENMASTTIGHIVKTVEVRGPDGTPTEVPSPAAAAGLQLGDRILSIDGRPIKEWRDVIHAVVTSSAWSDDGQRQSLFTIERDGVVSDFVVHPVPVGDDEIRHVGIGPAYTVVIDEVLPDSLAAEIGLQAGDELVSYQDSPIFSVPHFFELYGARPGEAARLVVRRNDETVTINIPARAAPTITGIRRNSIAHRNGLHVGDRIVAVDDTKVRNQDHLRDLLAARTDAFELTVEREGTTVTLQLPGRPPQTLLGIEFGHVLGVVFAAKELPPVRIPPLTQCVNVVQEAYRTLYSLLSPASDVGLSDISGPIEIVRVYHMVAQTGIRALLSLTILVNISLALFNILPIPVLDGGHMMFATIARIRNRPLSPEFLIKTQGVFMLLLLTMIIYVSYFNVRRWVRDAQSDRAEESMIRTNEDLPVPGGDRQTAAP